MSIKDIFAQTFQLVTNYKFEILKNTLVPIALLIGFFILFSSKFQGITSLPKELMGRAFINILSENLLYVVILIFLYLRLVINSYRMAILGPTSVAHFGLYLPRMRELKFIGYGFIFDVLLLLTMMVFMFLSGFLSASLGKYTPVIFMIGGFILSLFFYIRLSFVFPAIASDDNTRFSQSWQMTKGYVLKILVITLVFPFITTFLVSLVIKFIPALDNFLTYHIAGQLITWSVYLLFLVFVTMLLGVTYKTLKNKSETDSETQKLEV